MSVPSPPMAALAHSATLLQQVKYMDVASMTILLYDYLLSLELEISLVWGTRWSLSKIFYLCARYPPFIDVPIVLWYELQPNIDIKNCFPLYASSSWGAFFAILVLRTYALLGCNNRFLTWFVIQYVAIACATVVILSLFLKSLKFGAPPLPTVVGCQLVDGSLILVVAFILVLLNETILMICTLWVGVKRFRHSNNRLITTLYRDGISYFVLLFCRWFSSMLAHGLLISSKVISAANLAVLIWGPLELVDLFNTYVSTLTLRKCYSVGDSDNLAFCA
ncbi:hypothetical protein C8R46DRAFT_1289542 [Mycena filopes]|nr:hypothetical protein C8R46DRAFT_1289542 [Mycena filopes]